MGAGAVRRCGVDPTVARTLRLIFACIRWISCDSRHVFACKLWDCSQITDANWNVAPRCAENRLFSMLVVVIAFDFGRASTLRLEFARRPSTRTSAAACLTRTRCRSGRLRSRSSACRAAAAWRSLSSLLVHAGFRLRADFAGLPRVCDAADVANLIHVLLAYL